MTGLLISVDLNGHVRALEVAGSDAERETTAWLMSVVEPQLRPIRGLVLEALAARQSQAA
jgi:hypothetical protein